jgi:hypothetical protein
LVGLANLQLVRVKAEPTITIQVETVGPGTLESAILMQTDPTTLKHITAELEAALKASHSVS